MDHCWDGFYTCQQREQRFPTMLYQGTGSETYWVEYTGTPPDKQHFVYHSANTPGIMIEIKYSESDMSYSIQDGNGNIVAPTDWDDTTRDWKEIQRTHCGENRYVGVINVFQFFITPRTSCPGGGLKIVPRDAIMLGVRLEFTMDEFFASGGVTTFVDRMAAVLGIHAADIKVVDVKVGSVIVDFQIISNIIDDIPLNLDQVKETFETVMTTTKTFMGKDLIGAISTGAPIATPLTVVAESTGDVFEDIFGLGGDDDDKDDEKKEKDVKIEVVYQEVTVNQYGEKSGAGGYVPFFAMLILIVLLIVAALYLYRRIVTQSNRKVAE
jgi:hypothetical protein